ncbi:hypothetical protein CPC08DRAFT_748829 [Agrocybe pediades]|nr:hypothetical protein CPC08DRAFT_748829 [Agrocybe pediades]
MSRGRSRTRSPPMDKDADMEIDQPTSNDKPGARVVIVTNLTRNVVESHLKVIFGFYGHITKIDLPVHPKSRQNRGKAALEFEDSASAYKAASHMNGGQLDGAVLKVELSDLPIRAAGEPEEGATRARALAHLPVPALVLGPHHPTDVADQLQTRMPRETATEIRSVEEEEALVVVVPHRAMAIVTDAHARVRAPPFVVVLLIGHRRPEDALPATREEVMDVVVPAPGVHLFVLAVLALGRAPGRVQCRTPAALATVEAVAVPDLCHQEGGGAGAGVVAGMISETAGRGRLHLERIFGKPGKQNSSLVSIIPLTTNWYI